MSLAGQLHLAAKRHTEQECDRKKSKNLGVMPRFLTLEKEVLKAQT